MKTKPCAQRDYEAFADAANALLEARVLTHEGYRALWAGFEAALDQAALANALYKPGDLLAAGHKKIEVAEARAYSPLTGKPWERAVCYVGRAVNKDGSHNRWAVKPVTVREDRATLYTPS